MASRTAAVVRRAQQRGPAAADVEAGQAIESLLAPVYLRALLTRQPVDRPFVERVVDLTARALRP